MINKAVEIKKKADEIKALYENYLKFKEQKFSYANLETKDGTPLFIDEGSELKTGIPVYKMDENGSPMPCEDGTYELTDGSTIVVADGIIAEVKEATGGEESPAETAAPEAEKMEAPNTEDVEEVGENMENRMAALEKNLEKMMEMVQGLMAKYEQDLSKVSQKMNKLIVSTREELTRTSSEGESIKSKMNSESFSTDLKEYARTRGIKSLSKTPVKKESFGTQTNPDKASQLAEIRTLMSNARNNGGLGSIIATNAN